MLQGGKKLQRPRKTKFRKNVDRETLNLDKNKHHDKTLYRLVKEERTEYVV